MLWYKILVLVSFLGHLVKINILLYFLLLRPKNKGATLAYYVIHIKDLVKAYKNKLLDRGSNMRWIMDLTILVVPIGIKTRILDVGDI